MLSCQRCKLCGRADGIDFQITDNVWKQISGQFKNSVLCLRCFDYLANVKGIEYLDSIDDEVCFVGDAANFTFKIVSRSTAYGLH